MNELAARAMVLLVVVVILAPHTLSAPLSEDEPTLPDVLRTVDRLIEQIVNWKSRTRN